MEKTWGGEPFWGLGYEWDPDWFLTERQKELRAKLIELCETEMRANAKRSDDELLYPRRNFEVLAENGFLALTVPEEYGGLGENHVAFTMVCETLARYGCASTAMCYVMHIGAVATIMLLASSPSRLTHLKINSYANGTANLSWTPSPEKGVTGYIVAHGASHITVTEPKAVLQVPAGTTVSVKAVNARGLESWDAAKIKVH